MVARGVTGGGAWPSHPDILRLWIERLERSGERLTDAILAGVDAPLVAPTEKAALRAATGAAAADMESHLAAAFAATRRVPFAALRVVCDPAERGLPPLAAEALRPDGTLDSRRSCAASWRGRRSSRPCRVSPATPGRPSPR